jgi:hypothetical protein
MGDGLCRGGQSFLFAGRTHSLASIDLQKGVVMKEAVA